ncbi:MAG TPA: hypothetical protein VL135_13625 [Terracidiphilus sp.]|jgi:hypothetical protein|nr:hypothetical protein [Terracidiphilus sp.]
MTTCSHTLANGQPCNAPALNNCSTCRHHDPNRPHTEAQPRAREYQPLHLPPLVNKNGVLAAIAEVIHAISERRIKRSEGGTMLFGLQLASRLMTELDQMPLSEEEYADASANLPASELMNSPENLEKLEERRATLAAAGNHWYVPSQEEMKGFMANFECANAEKLAKIIAAKRDAWERRRAASSLRAASAKI